MSACEKNIIEIPVVTTQPANTDLVMFTDAAGNTVLRTWATIKQWLESALSGVQPPTALAGVDQVITLPTNFGTLTGSGTGGSGTITSYQWSHVSGPSGFVIDSPNTASTGISSLAAGVHIFRLVVTNSNGHTAQDDVKVVVNYATAVNFTAHWAWFNFNPSGPLHVLDNLDWQENGVFTNGMPVVTNYSAAPPDMWLAMKEPVSQPVKTQWINTPGFNEGNIPDSVFKATFVTAGWRYYITWNRTTMNPNETIFQ